MDAAKWAAAAVAAGELGRDAIWGIPRREGRRLQAVGLFPAMQLAAVVGGGGGRKLPSLGKLLWWEASFATFVQCGSWGWICCDLFDYDLDGDVRG